MAGDSLCSSFVVLCRAQSMRHEINSFLGDTSRGFVVIGKALGEMSSLLYFIAWCLCMRVVLEQPHSSCLPSMPSMSTLFRFCGAKKYVTYMGQYGGSSMKQLQLWSLKAQDFRTRMSPTFTWRWRSFGHSGWNCLHWKQGLA